MARVLTQVSSRRGGPSGQTPTYTTTLPLGPLFSDADLFFRARNSTVVSSSNINTVRSANVSALKQLPKNRKFSACPDLLIHQHTGSASELEEVVVALKGIQVKHQ
ncbi:hypothetical protein ARMGADRAFT_1015500 [Armillaria gallica]|uniref:Uncharacterized protein n=1 Tax=Armillaria gallica TaxID=47427 RepID=A0A2H3D6E2_ARMGA|nr:hypothetical protein ARMGADRAFT_1015500 [Armillaria gallica]